MFHVSFDMDYRTRVAASRAINQVLPSQAWLRWGAFAALGLAIVLEFTGQIGAGLIIGLYPAVYFPLTWMTPYYMAWISRGLPEAHQQDLTFGDEGIQVKGVGAGIVRWNAVARVADTRQFLVLFTLNQQAFAVPKGALRDAAEASDLAAFIAERIKSGQNMPDIAPAPPTPALVSVEYVTNRREIYDAVMASARYGPALWPTYVVVLGVACLPLLFRMWRQWSAGDPITLNVPAGLLAAFFLVGILSVRPFASMWIAYRFARSKGGLVAQRLGVTADGLQFTSSRNEGFFAWSSFLKVAESARFFFFFVTKAQAVAVPKRVIDPSGVQLIRELAAQKVDRSRLVLMGNE